MRKLLYLAAGAALLSAPAAFAQNDSASNNQPSPVIGSSGTSATTDSQATASTDAKGDAQANGVQGAAQDPPSDPQAPATAPSMDEAAPPVQAAPPPDQAAPPDQGAPPQAAAPGAYNDQSRYQGQYQGQYSSPSQPAPGYYVQNGENQGQSVQVISNAPVPDTRSMRRRFPPLSRAGRRTAPVGN